MILQKWDFGKRKYKPYKVPDDWNVKVYVADLNEVINCVTCGKEVIAGQCITSQKVHTDIGFGYMICEDCFKKECRERGLK